MSEKEPSIQERLSPILQLIPRSDRLLFAPQIQAVIDDLDSLQSQLAELRRENEHSDLGVYGTEVVHVTYDESGLHEATVKLSEFLAPPQDKSE